MQKRMCDTAWSDEKKLWQGLRHGEPQTVPLSVMVEVRNHDPEGLGKWEQCKGLKCRRKVWKWQRGITSHPPVRENKWRRTTCQSGSANLKSTKAGACQLVAWSYHAETHAVSGAA